MTTNCKPLTGVYAGTFDPVTYGHFDVIRRAGRMVDRLIIGVAQHTGKQMTFSMEERVSFIEQHLEEFIAEDGTKDIAIMPVDGLLVDFVAEQNAKVVFRGLRAVADFDYEFQMAMMNARLAPDIETVFLMASERNQFIASRFVKEVARLGGDVSSFAPSAVRAALMNHPG